MKNDNTVLTETLLAAVDLGSNSFKIGRAHVWTPVTHNTLSLHDALPICSFDLSVIARYFPEYEREMSK